MYILNIPEYVKIIIFAVLFVLHWYGSIITHSGYLHRYLTHAQFIMSVRMQKTVHFLYWLFNGSCYLSPVTYAKMHTLHHLYPDTEIDPHSPRYHKKPLKFLWRTWTEFNKTHQGGYDKELAGYEFKHWDALDRIADRREVRILWAILYAAIYWILVPYWFMIPFYIVTILMGPIHGFIVNWFAHKVGYKNFDDGNDSRNVIKHDWLLVGELLHNNHHHNKGSYTFAIEDNNEVDPLGNLLLWLAKKNIVTLPSY